MRYIAALTFGICIFSTPLIAKKPSAPISPLDKISRTFSDDKMGRTTMPKGAKLMQSEFNHPDCTPTNLSDCYVRDGNGVELYFSPYDGLNSKEVEISPDYNGPIKALNIRTARSQKDVMAVMDRYWRFHRNQKFLCERYMQVGGDVSKNLNCTADIGAPENQDRPSIELTFNENDRLISVSVRASSYID